MQEQMNLSDELAQKQLEAIEHTLNRLIGHRAEIMDVLTLEDFSSKALLSTPLPEQEILGLFPQVKEVVIEQKTLEAGYRQLLLDFEGGLTDLINKYNDLKEAIESERARWEEGQQHINDDNTDDILRKYWDEFREYCDNHGMSLERVTWNRNPQYEGFRLSIKSVPDSKIWLATWRNPKGSSIAVNLSLKLTTPHSEGDFDDLGIFNALKEKKEVIENAFGKDLIWQEKPSFLSLGPVVGVYKNITPDKDDWQKQFEWMFTRLEKLNQVFRPFILESLESNDQIDYV